MRWLAPTLLALGCGGNLSAAQRCRVAASFEQNPTARAVRLSNCTQVEAIEATERMHAERMHLERQRLEEQRQARECLRLATLDARLERSEHEMGVLLVRIQDAQTAERDPESLRRAIAMELELQAALSEARAHRRSLREGASCPELLPLTAGREPRPEL